MKLNRWFGLFAALSLGTGVLGAQESNEVETLKRQLQQVRENFLRSQAEHQRQIESLLKQVEALQQKQSATAAEQEKLKQQVAAAPPPAREPAATDTPKKPWRPSDPIRIGSGGSYANFSLDGLFAVGGSTADDLDQLQLGGHDPSQRGFTVQNVELAVDGAVDPYFRGQGNLIFFINPEGETVVELEEAFLESTSLPANLQVKAGQFFTEFGRHNPTHPHAWGFVDAPLVNGRFFGADGLRNAGARLSWLAPTPFYSELFFTVQNSHGETASSFRSGGHSHGGEEEEGIPFAFRHADNDRGVGSLEDLLLSARYALSFEVGEQNTLLAGLSGAWGPNSSGMAGNTRTEIYGADVTWKWKPASSAGGFPFVSLTAEAMVRRSDAGVFDWDEDGNLGDGDGNSFPDEGVLVDATGATPAVLGAETLTDYGAYAQLLYGFRKGWVAGVRVDYVAGDTGGYERQGFLVADNAGGGEAATDLFRARRWRVSPNLTWYPSEFSKIRLQYNYDDRESIGVDHSVWLQFEFLLGAHAAHKF
jgi:hypothetical protein